MEKKARGLVLFLKMAIAATAAIRNTDRAIVRIRPVVERNWGSGDWVGESDSEGEVVCCGVVGSVGWVVGVAVGVGVTFGSWVGDGLGDGLGDKLGED